MVIDLIVMAGYRSGAMNWSSYEEYSLQISVLMARMQTELNTRKKLKKRLLEFAGMSQTNEELLNG